MKTLVTLALLLVASTAHAEDRTPQQQINDRLSIILGIAPSTPPARNLALDRYLNSETSKNYVERQAIIGGIADGQMQYQPPTQNDGMQRAIRESLIESTINNRYGR